MDDEYRDEYEEYLESLAAMTPEERRAEQREDIRLSLTDMMIDYEVCVNTFFDYESWWYGTENLLDGQARALRSLRDNRNLVLQIRTLNAFYDLPREFNQLEDITQALINIQQFLRRGPLLFENLEIVVIAAVEHVCTLTEHALDDLRAQLDQLAATMN